MFFFRARANCFEAIHVLFAKGWVWWLREPARFLVLGKIREVDDIRESHLQRFRFAL